MEYTYYGAEHSITPVNLIYCGLDTPQKLYEAFMCGAWTYETCSPGFRAKWIQSHKSLGQCSTTALIVQDIFGGEIYGIPLGGTAVHSYNLIDGKIIDLASEQFGEKVSELNYDCSLKLNRVERLSDDEKRSRYEMLKENLIKYCATAIRDSE